MDKKPLYICSSLVELQKKSEMNKMELYNVKTSCHILNKLFEQFEKCYLDQDEELAFIYINRFLFMFSEIRKSFRKDIVYINALFNSKKIDMAFEKATSLKNSLKSRYESVTQITKEITESPEIVSKLPKYTVTATELYKSIKSMENILIVDTRSTDEYLNCHINYKQIVNIPSNELKKGCSIVDVNKLLEKRNNEQELDIWNKRQLATSVILLAWKKENDSINLVKDAIFKWDATGSIKEPLILESGLHSFLTHYPIMVTDPKYRGPTENKKKDIIPEDIQYPDWDFIEAEKKRKTDLDKNKLEKEISEDENEMTENILESKAKTNKTSNSVISNDREGKFTASLNTVSIDVKPNIIVDRTLKPQQNRVINENGPISPKIEKKTIITNSDIAISTNIESKIDSSNEKPVIFPDRSLKPQVLREVNRDNIQIQLDTNTDLESTEITPSLSTPSEITRLSNNSRTNQDRTNFAVKGGAKSIPPPTNTIDLKKKNLPPWIVSGYDNNTNEYYYYDQRNHCRIPEQCLENIKENSIQQDHVESLKDHSVTSKASTKPITGSSLKRSTSQPNLSEEGNSPQKLPISPDSTLTTHSSKQIDPPTLNRQNKPIYQKTFTEFPANRLNNFNPSYKTVTPGLTGLRNMGNTCYLNSVVQALSNTKFLSNYILTDSYRHDINRDNPLGYGGEIVTEFAFLTTALWTGTYREVSPSDFKRMIDGKNEMFRGCEQHDSQEFLLFLLDGLHEDLNRGSKHMKVLNPPNEEKLTDSERAQHSWKKHIAVNDSVIVRIFQGQYRSKVTCDFCQMSSVTFDTFMYLSLPLVPNHNRCSLEDCLKLFLAEERMTGASQWFCPKCKTNRNAKKKIDIWKLPPYLLIHLKRFSCTGQYRQKLNTFVDFPMESFSLVDILQHTNQSQKHDTYHLYAVSNHHGNMESGHYTSFCKNMKENEWYNYDDDVVNKIRDSDVKTASAYILFYESYNLKQASYKS